MLVDEGVYYSTSVSLSDRVPEPPDRRQDHRHMTILRVGKLVTAAGPELCLVRNISAGGLMAHVYSIHLPEEEVIVELKNDLPVSGTIQWVAGSNIGVRFDQRVNVSDLLSGTPSLRPGLRPRAPRIEKPCRARLRIGSDRAPACLLDISQGGAKIECSYALFEGDEVVLTIPLFRSINASVRWVRGGLAGVEFVRPLAYGELTAWLRQNFD
jgi:hypothetical protein